MDITPQKRLNFAERLNKACVARYGRKHGVVSYLAGKVNVSASTASRWLNGDITPNREHRKILAKTLDTPLSWLQGEDFEPPDFIKETISSETELVGRSGALLYPLVYRIAPDTPPEKIHSLIVMTYTLLKNGEPENAVLGEIIKSLFQPSLTE